MLETMFTTPVSRVMRRDHPTLTKDRNVMDAMIEMRERHAGAVLITEEDGSLAGIFTERDVLTLSSGESWREQPLVSVMTADPITVNHSDSLADALRIMKEKAFRHVPILDESGRAVGILSIRQVLGHVVDHFPQEFFNLPPDPTLEATGPYGG